MPWPSERLSARLFALSAFAVPLAYLLVARLAFGFDGLSGQDGHEYARYAAAIGDWLSGGAHPGWHYWPVGYTLTGGLLGKAIGDPIQALQLVSAVGLGATAVAVNGILLRLYPGDAEAKMRLLAACVVLILPALVQAGLLVMSDMFAAALAALALWAWLELRQAPSVARLVLFALAATAAVWTRYGVFALLVIPGGDVLRIALTRLPRWTILCPILVAAPFILSHLAIKQADAAGLFSQYALQSWSPANWFSSQFSTADGVSSFALPNLVFALSFFARPTWFPLLLLLPFARPRDFARAEVRLMLAAGAVYLLFVAGIPFQNPRFQLPVAPLAIVLLFPASRRLAGLIGSRALKLAGLALIGVGALFLQVRHLTPHLERNRLERQIADRLHAYPAETPLYLFAFDPALMSRRVRQPMHNLWRQRYAQFPEGALVLFAPEKLTPQWHGRNPMLNWDHLVATKRLSVEAEFGQGWRLYRVGGAR